MTPQEVIDNANDMSIWDNAVWVNTQQGTFFVPIWRNGNTKFLYIAEQFGYTLENNYDVTGLIGYAFVRQPEKRIVGQIKRAMVNQDWSFEDAVNNAKGNKHELDVHLLSQHSFLDQYPLRYCIDLDDIRKTGHEHIDSVLDEFIHDDQRPSQVIDETVNELITPHIIDLYHEDRMPSVGIVGVGNIGSVLADVLTQKNVVVKRFDIHEQYDTLEDVRACDVIWICVDTPTTQDYGDYDYTNLNSALNYFENKVIIVGCTVSPGTIRTLHTKNCVLIYMPFLISQGNVADGLIEPDCWFIGGVYNRSVNALVSRLSNAPKHWGTWQEAEMAKVLYNCWIIQKINFANWASDLAYEVVGNADAQKVMRWLGESNKLITSDAYMRPGWGDGGPCHPRDNLMMSYISGQKLGYDPAWNQHTTRLAQAKLMAKRAVATGLPVIILGKSYKAGTDSTEGSYSLVVAEQIELQGGTVYFEDHLTSGDYCYILAHNDFYGHEPSERSTVINPWV